MAPVRSRKSRDSGCCSVNFLKCALQIFNVLCLASGLAVFGIALWTLLNDRDSFVLGAGAGCEILARVLAAAGLLAALGGVIGCGAVCREHRGVILFCTFLLLLVFLLQATVGIISSIYKEQVGAELNASLPAIFIEKYEIDEAQTKAIDSVQRELKCCGANSFEDWMRSLWLQHAPLERRVVPDSCCKTEVPYCGKSDHPSNIPYTGCIHRMTNRLEHQLLLLGAVGLGMCTLQIFGMIFNCCLYVKLKDIIDD